MPLTQYRYGNAISGFFEYPTDHARRILPAHLEPVEVHHGTSIFSLSAFHFTESEVGAYGEVVMAVMAVPLVKPGERLPKAAYYPYLVGTTTKAARDHAIERWHLPHWMEDVEIDFSQEGRGIEVNVRADGVLVAEMSLTEHSWNPVSHRYQCFMKDGQGAYLAHITMEGVQSEHEEETGHLVLHEHPLHKDLVVSEVSDVPFRELWMREGVQSFEPLVQLEPV
jgi:hypothetical protein